jgi:hypothetical protein
MNFWLKAQTERNKPYGVQSILQSALLRPTSDKALHGLQLVCTATLESTGVVENITIMLWEHNLMLDVMFATLHKPDPEISTTDGEE